MTNIDHQTDKRMKKGKKTLAKERKAKEKDIENVKKTDNHLQILKGAKVPQFLDIPISEKQKTRVLTPKNIVRFSYPQKHFLVFGDERCSPRFFEETLQEYFEKQIVLLMFSRSTQDQISIPVPLDEILKSRKRRLAIAISLKAQDDEQFLRDELENYDESVSFEDLEIDFLSSLKTELIIKDIKRIIQIYHQS